MKEIILQKKTETGAFQNWSALINGKNITYSWGQIGGSISTKPDVGEVKNEGRANEVSAEQDAINKCVVKARRKVQEGYKVLTGQDIIDANTFITVQDRDLEIPSPMLAQRMDSKAYEEKILGCNKVVAVQHKLDGYRMMFNRNTKKLYSRSRKEIKSVPHLNEAAFEATKNFPKEVEWFDGEVFSNIIPFNQIQHILGKTKDIDEADASLMEWHVFDILASNPFSERWEYIDKYLVESDLVKKVKTQFISPDQIEAKQEQYVSEGAEGLIIRTDFTLKGKNKIMLGYESKRSYCLWKYKQFDDDEFEILGTVHEVQSFAGKDYDTVGVVTLKMKNGNVFKARPKMSVTERADLWKNKSKMVGKMGKVKYQGLGKEDGCPRFPVFIGLRANWDK